MGFFGIPPQTIEAGLCSNKVQTAAMPGLPTPLSQVWSLNPEPEILSDLLVELVDSENAPGSYVRLAPGTPYPDQSKYPSYIFLTQKTVGHDKVNRYWTTPEYQNQDVYNWELDYVSDSSTHPIYVRRYKTRRDKYTELARGTTTLSGIWKINVTNAGSGYDPDNPPTVTIGGTGSGASATALVNVDGSISFIRITAEGTGYTTATVTVSAPSAGATATATATLQASTCVLIKQQTNNFPEDDPRYALFLIETRIFQTFPGPVITKWEWEPRIERYVKVDKQLILKSIVPADPNAQAATPGVTVEYQDLTAVYSAKITTTVPSNMVWENDGEDFVYSGFINHRFPNQITRNPTIIVAFLLNSKGVAIDYGWDCKVDEGYSGPCKAEIRERYTFDPTDPAFIAALPTPTQIFPNANTIFVRSYGINPGGSPIADVQTFVVPMVLHPVLEIQQDVNGAVQDVSIDVTPDLPATVPPKFETGDTLTVVSEPQRIGIGGLWVVRIATITHP